MKTILITGTTKGIGKAIVELLKEDYYIIGINRNRDDAVSENIICDLYDVKRVQDMCAYIEKYNIDVLINNAGGSKPCKFDELSLEQITNDINLNFVSPILLMKAVIIGMQKREYGRIINISSISAKTATPYLHTYSAAKSALDSMTNSCAVVFGEHNITINSICPGAVDTESSVSGRKIISKYKGLESEQYQKIMIKGTGLNRMVRADEVASLVSFLLSDQAAAISGQRFNICGTLEMN